MSKPCRYAVTALPQEDARLDRLTLFTGAQPLALVDPAEQPGGLGRRTLLCLEGLEDRQSVAAVRRRGCLVAGLGRRFRAPVVGECALLADRRLPG